MLRTLNNIQILRNGKCVLDSMALDRFLSNLKIPNAINTRSQAAFFPSTLRIFVIAAEKDFPVLREVVSAAINNLENFEIISVDLIVPKLSIKNPALLDLANSKVKIRLINEEDVLDTKTIENVFSTSFPGREKWCLQQFLKLYSVLESETDFSLVIDADTILLRKISWTSRDGRQILMPTLEYQYQYYEILLKLELIDSFPKYSFVPHHMFYSKHYLHLMYKKLGKPSAIEFAKIIESLSGKGSPSPFCIDYELYAQFMYKHYNNEIALTRWANLSISREKFIKINRFPGALKILKLFFNSISVHSWNG